jgi:hypothetical protein
MRSVNNSDNSNFLLVFLAIISAVCFARLKGLEISISNDIFEILFAIFFACFSPFLVRDGSGD